MERGATHSDAGLTRRLLSLCLSVKPARPLPAVAAVLSRRSTRTAQAAQRKPSRGRKCVSSMSSGSRTRHVARCVAYSAVASCTARLQHAVASRGTQLHRVQRRCIACNDPTYRRGDVRDAAVVEHLLDGLLRRLRVAHVVAREEALSSLRAPGLSVEYPWSTPELPLEYPLSTPRGSTVRPARPWIIR